MAAVPREAMAVEGTAPHRSAADERVHLGGTTYLTSFSPPTHRPMSYKSSLPVLAHLCYPLLLLRLSISGSPGIALRAGEMDKQWLLLHEHRIVSSDVFIGTMQYVQNNSRTAYELLLYAIV